MQSVMAIPPVEVVILKSKPPPKTLKLNSDKPISPLSHIPFPSESWNLEICMKPHIGTVVVVVDVVVDVVEDVVVGGIVVVVVDVVLVVVVVGGNVVEVVVVVGGGESSQSESSDRMLNCVLLNDNCHVVPLKT